MMRPGSPPRATTRWVADESVPLVAPGRPQGKTGAQVRVPWLFAAAMGAALAVAAIAGTGLGMLAALETWIGQTQWTASVQGHGRVQLFSFAAVFVAALAFEFVVRLNGRQPLPAWPRVVVLALIGAGAVAMAAAQLLEGRVPGLLVGGALAGLAGAGGFFALIARVRPARPLRIDVQPLFFPAAGAWLVVAAVISVVAAANATGGILGLADSRAVSELVLRGFVLNVVAGVALRALPGHLGVRPLRQGQMVLVFAGLNTAVVLWLAGSGAPGMAAAGTMMRVGDVLLALAVVAFTWWSGVLRAFRMPGTGVERYQSLVPLAWLGLVAYAVALAGFALAGGLHERTLYQEGAVRHILMLGFMAPLMLAFAHIVLARFGTGRIAHENALTAAFLLLMVAWPLRVIPALFTDMPSDMGRMVIAGSGVMVAVAFAMAAFVCVATARRIAAAHRGHGRGIAVH